MAEPKLPPPADEATRRAIIAALRNYNPPRIRVSAVHDNLDQEVIQVTCDGLKIRLTEHLQNVESRRSWIAPAGIVATTLAALCTTEFKDVLGLTKATWQAIFVMAFLAGTAWLAVTLIKRRKAETIDDVIDSLRKV